MNSLTDWRSAFFLGVVSNRLSSSPDTKLTPSWTCRNAGFSLFLAPGWTSGPPSADPAIWDMRTKEPICTVKWMFLFVHKSIYSYQCCAEIFPPEIQTWINNMNQSHCSVLWGLTKLLFELVAQSETLSDHRLHKWFHTDKSDNHKTNDNF